jgi:ACT domain-containing protein
MMAVRWQAPAVCGIIAGRPGASRAAVVPPTQSRSASMPAASERVIVSVIGRDRTGIIAGVTTVLAQSGANILDISQSVMEDFFVMIMMVDISAAGISLAELKQRLHDKGEEMGLRIDAQHEDVFKYMHRI